jgi:hypothetical protein
MVMAISIFYQINGNSMEFQVKANGFSTDRLFSPDSSTNKTDCHDITELLLKVVLNTIKHSN